MAAPVTGTHGAAGSAPGSPTDGVHAPSLQLFVFALFFVFGGITSLNDILIPKFKELFTLSWTQAMLVQFCFFTAYLLVGLPGAQLVKRLGYMRGAVVGLLTMVAGCLLFIPAAQTATYGLFLFALFILASGVVIVQVVANPLISLLGPQRTVHSRLTFAQAFNSLGTTVFPYVGAGLILGALAGVSADQLSGAELAAYRAAEADVIWRTYAAIAAALAALALAVFAFRNRLPREAHQPTPLFAGFDLLRRARFRFGALGIFLYVGAEVAIGSVLVNYLSQADILGISELSAGELLIYYWGGAMVGRFIGSAVLRVIDPGKVLASVALGAIALILTSIASTGPVAGYSLLAVGLMNAIMFPTIFSLACEGLGDRAADGSGVINVAIFGGAVVPLLTGALADATGRLGLALLLPVACYAVIAAFGWSARRAARRTGPGTASA